MLFRSRMTPPAAPIGAPEGIVRVGLCHPHDPLGRADRGGGRGHAQISPDPGCDHLGGVIGIARRRDQMVGVVKRDKAFGMLGGGEQLRGVLDPHGSAVEEWRFHGVCIARAKKASRLRRDLGINVPGVAMVLQLLEERHAVLRRLYQYEAK